MTEIAKEYAEALFLLACEEREEKEIMTALEDTAALFEETPQLVELFSSPAVSLKERQEAITEIFEDRLPTHALSFLRLLCEKGRIHAFVSCVEEYRRLLRIQESVISAKVVSAVPLTEEEKLALTRNLEKKSGKTVTLDCSTDPSLLGGVIVEMDGVVMDGSLRHRLREVKDVMNG